MTRDVLEYRSPPVQRPGTVPGKIVFWACISILVPLVVFVFGGFLQAAVTG
jgi:hypothetical protein